MTQRWRRVLRAGAVAGLVATVLRPRGAVPELWRRTNFRGESVDLREGPQAAAAVLAGIGAAEMPARQKAGALVAVGSAAGAGLLDDLVGTTSIKGLRGHLSALASGRVTTGSAKILLIGAGALGASALFTDPTPSAPSTSPVPSPRRARRCGEILLDAGVIALAAHVVNLVDLRPGRAIKAAGVPATFLSARAGAPGAVATAALGASGVIVRDDLAERTMLGDCGAAALGAAVGVAAVQGATLRFRLAALAGLAGLTAAAERVSFSEVIANNPVLSRIDAAGRRHQGVPK